MENSIRVREEIWQSVNSLTNEQLNEVVGAEKWTIAQVLEHLYLTEKLMIRSFPQAKKVDETNPVKLRKLHLVVDREYKVEAPSFLVPSNDYQTLEQLKGKLNDSRGTLIKLYYGLSEQDLLDIAIPHPVFNALTLKQWVSFIGFHEKRHLAQIEELKGLLSK